jgi:4-amino-4-deoxy-L-arabinose transferase-like glycosyltransferase
MRQLSHRRLLISLGLIVLFGISLRLFKINSFPSGVSYDELEFINNGYSLVNTGRDLYGKALPLTVGNNGHVSLPAYFSGVTGFFFGLNIWSARLLPALMGTIEIFLIFGISLILFRKSSLALWSALLFTVSPWSLIMSRAMFDPPLSLFFFLSGIFVFLRGKTSKILVLGITFLSLGFLSYYGALFFFPFVIVSLLWYRWKDIRASRAFWVSSLLVWIFTAGIYFLSVSGGQLNRTGELIFNVPKISAEVVFNSFTSNAPLWTNRIFVNKATVTFHTFLRNYLDAFSPRIIFADGDTNRIYGLWDRGELELYLLPLVIIGSIFAYLTYRRQFYLVAVLLLVSPFTVGVSSPAYATRAFLLWPCLILLGAVGAQQVWSKYSRLRLIFIAILVYSFSATFHQYFYRYPVYASELWFDSQHQLAEYLLANPSSAFDIYTPENRQLFMEYFFYAKGNPLSAQTSLAGSSSPALIKFNYLNFIYGCPSSVFSDHSQIVHYTCGPDSQFFRPLIAARDKSSRVIWYIRTP